MLELVLIRHGETASNIKGTHLGTTDVPLNERGKRQALALQRVFAKEEVSAVYTSPLSRAKDTAEAIAKKHDTFVEPVMDLIERNYGIWEDMTIDEIRDKYPEEHAQWQKDWIHYVIPQGESAMDVYNRNVSVVQELLKVHTEGRIIVVTHMGCIRNILSYLFHMNVEDGWHFRARNAGICRLELDDYGFATMHSFNEI